MPRSATTPEPQPYRFFGTFAGLPFWPGGLTLLSAAPGIGKTSWLLRMIMEAAQQGFPAALGCYEHTAEELKYRLRLQAEAAVGGAHGKPDAYQVEALLAKSGEAVLIPLSDQEDTIRGIEEMLLQDYNFPVHAPALLAVDYLQRIPVIGVTGMVSEERRGGEAAAMLRSMARRHGWAVIAASALRASAFEEHASEIDLSALLGDERVTYEPDRVLMMWRKSLKPCGCAEIIVKTLKDRTGPTTSWQMEFWGERFYPALNGEQHG
ncbi:MAG: hypothetical protein HPY45_09765 [Anaerolineae bacterium]|nr:hypothetical protein [Anaerolineae bacterium]